MYFSPSPLFHGFDQRLGHEVVRRQLASLVLGGSLTAWFGDWTGVEWTIGYAASTVAIKGSHQTVDVPTGIILTSARLIMSTQRRAGRWAAYLSPGFGTVRRGSAAGTVPDLEPALVGALGLWLGLTGAAGVRFELADYLSRLGYLGAAMSDQRRFHHNAMLSVSFSLPMGSGL